MKLIEKLFFIVFLFTLVLYSYAPISQFPPPPPDAVQSMEEADTESPLRRAYFTNFEREEVISHYKSQFSKFYTLRLNYPPEDAQTLIRDQTRSRYLEELVHPLRESVYVNGFIPTQSKDDIWYKGEHYYQKITVRYVPSLLLGRLIVSLGIFGLSLWLYGEWRITASRTISIFRKEGENE